MSNKKEFNKIDELYDAIGILMMGGCWNFLDEVLIDKANQAWRIDIDILVEYATATFPGKSKLPHRTYFIECCRKFHPDVKNWSGLE